MPRGYSFRGVRPPGKKGDHDREIADLTELIRLDPNFAVAILAVVSAYRKRAMMTGRLPTSPRPSGSTRTTPHAYCNRGEVLLEECYLSTFITDCTDAIRLKPDYAVAYFGLGVAYKRMGENAKAEEDFAQAKNLGYKAP